MRLAAVAAAAAAADCPAAAAAAAANSRSSSRFVVHSSDDMHDATAAPTAGFPLVGEARAAASSWIRPGTVDAGKRPLDPCSPSQTGNCGCSARRMGLKSTRRRRQNQMQQRHRQQRPYCSVCAPNTGRDGDISDGESSFSSASGDCTPDDIGMPSGGSDAATSSSTRDVASSCCRGAIAERRGRHALQNRQEPHRPWGTADSIDFSCSRSLVADAAAEATSAEAKAEAVAASVTMATEDTENTLCAWLRLGGAVGVLVKWLGVPSLLQSCTKWMCDGMYGLLLLLLRMQRQQFLRRRCQDLMEKYTHSLSDGRFRAERHSVCTADGHEIHFYRLRRVTRSCCGGTCACATLGLVGGMGDAAEAATPAAAAAASMPSGGNCNSISNTSDCKGQVFFFEHGLLESSLNWISGGWRSLPFIVAARGGEVWLANSRGNEYTRLLKGQQQQQQQQQADRPPVTHPTTATASAQVGKENPKGFSLFTLHAFIAEQQQRLHFLKQQQHQFDSQASQQQRPVVQPPLDSPEEDECCSLFCCRCSGLTSLPCVQGQPPQQQHQLLQKACIDASDSLLRMGWTCGDVLEDAAVQQQQQQQQNMHATADEDEIRLLPSVESYAVSTMTTEVEGATTATAQGACTRLPATALLETSHLNANVQNVLFHENTTSSVFRTSTRGSTCRLSGSCSSRVLQQLLENEAASTVGSNARLPAEENSMNTRSCDVIGQSVCANLTCRNGACWGCSYSSSSKGRSRNAPPFEFCQDAVEGCWSFHEMAMYDCPAQLQYIAMNSPIFKRRRAAVFAAASASSHNSSCSSSNGQSAFGCGLVAVGQSQGAAQLLVALSTSPSLCLLASRVVLFSPPLVLQQLQQLPRAALLLMQLGVRHPMVLLKALRCLVGFIPGGVLAAVGNAVVGTGRPGSLRFYSTPLQHQQLVLNFAHTPSGGTSRQNFTHWLQQLRRTQPLATLADQLPLSAGGAPQTHRGVWLQGVLEPPDAAEEEQKLKQHTTPIDGVEVEASQPQMELPELKIPQGRYPLERISSEVYAFLGSQDNLVASAASAAYLERCIPKERLHLHVLGGLSHLDFGWGRDRANDLYPELLARVAKCNAPSACGCLNET